MALNINKNETIRNIYIEFCRKTIDTKLYNIFEINLQ